MGLAGPRKRAKIAHDPNNTTWTRKKGLGHNLLVSQGWQPGQTLGARNAPHASTYTAGSHSYIRTLLRADNLGLGARYSGDKNGTESTGLDAFQGILGRLNGKTDEALAKEQKSRDDARRNIYAEQRWGSLRFVSGGTLHGDNISALVSTRPKQSPAPGAFDKSESTFGNSKFEEEASTVSKKERKEAKRKRKAEKSQRKLERAQRKAAKFLGRDSEDSVSSVKEKSVVAGTESPLTKVSQSEASSRTESPSGRQALRQRYIKQKRLAYSDAQALKEILMVKF